MAEVGTDRGRIDSWNKAAAIKANQVVKEMGRERRGFVEAAPQGYVAAFLDGSELPQPPCLAGIPPCLMAGVVVGLSDQPLIEVQIGADNLLLAVVVVDLPATGGSQFAPQRVILEKPADAIGERLRILCRNSP